MRLRFIASAVLAAASCSGSSSQPGIQRPSTCGGTVAAQGQIDSAVFSADYIRVTGVNGNAIVVSLADTTKAPVLTVQLARDSATGSFPTGAVHSEAALYAPSRVGSAELNVTTVVDPYDTSGSPLVDPDGGSFGSIEATFTATFTGAMISGSFSSPVCETTDHI